MLRVYKFTMTQNILQSSTQPVTAATTTTTTTTVRAAAAGLVIKSTAMLPEPRVN